ncbi:RING-H2 finger protein ATL13-like [Senna tora]|uniref:RING-type E3 ubiquitin transferase n=1 Tax=Senna tora TaxID=362788 RepID=A0A834SPK0_9FABA|nr:RING-H2 finger protein ATL13-like [Senna tora]
MNRFLQSSNSPSPAVSPGVLLLIIILAVVFFLSGLLHLLLRFLWRSHPPPDPHDLHVTALQGQLQHLFHLHDSGVDQSFIDTLPVFPFSAIIGLHLKTPSFDCAVCLCEFQPHDKLRLLPNCSHAFHVDCIDTWLLSHSTCPLCRSTLLHHDPLFSRPPIVLVLESGSDTSAEIVPQQQQQEPASVSGSGSESVSGSARLDAGEAVTVKLGKFTNVDGDGGGCSENGEARRCFSMGSFAYVMDENSSLRVLPIRGKIRKKQAFPLLTPGHRAARSECDCESRRELGFSGVVSRRESFSVSKIWLRGKEEEKEEKQSDDEMGGGSLSSARRAVSFRLPLQSGNGDENLRGKLEARSAISEGNRSCYSLEESWRQEEEEEEVRGPSFARRTLLWLTGKQSKSASTGPSL